MCIGECYVGAPLGSCRSPRLGRLGSRWFAFGCCERLEGNSERKGKIAARGNEDVEDIRVEVCNDR
jgi:hypothetical protein